MVSFVLVCKYAMLEDDHCSDAVKPSVDFEGLLSDLVEFCSNDLVSIPFLSTSEVPRVDFNCEAAVRAQTAPAIEGNLLADLKRSCELGSSFNTGISMDLSRLRCS